jgi:hypothetical protein
MIVFLLQTSSGYKSSPLGAADLARRTLSTALFC